MQKGLGYNMNFRVKSIIGYFFIAGSVITYILLAYYTARTDHRQLFISFAFLFLAYFFMIRSTLSWRELMAAGVIFRMLFIIALPVLSDNFYRYIWDGNILLYGLNPFSYSPSEIIHLGVDIPIGCQDMYPLLNSQSDISIYPPVTQFIFWISAYLSNGEVQTAVFIMRVFALLAEFTSFYYMRKLFLWYGLDERRMFYYVLNPLVIVEITGNLHFEFLVVLFILVTIYYKLRQRIFISSSALALAIAAKVWPVLFVPFFYKRMPLKRYLVWMVLVVTLSVILLSPMIFGKYEGNTMQIIHAYLQSKTFNAGVYSLFTYVLQWTKSGALDFAIKFILPAIMVLVLAACVFEDKQKENMPSALMWPAFIFFALISIVQPWYIIPLLALSIYTTYKFPIVWTFCIILSYAGYKQEGFVPPYLMYAIEYTIVFIMALFEIKRNFPFNFSGLFQLFYLKKKKIA